MTTAERIAPASLFDGAATLAERLRRSVVAIGGRGGAGAGTVWRPGLIVTNHHVARAGSMRVETPDGDTLDGRVVARDPRHDLAAIESPGAELPPVETRDAASLRTGELLFAVGHPWGQRGSVSAGVVLTTAGTAGEHTVPLAETVRADLRLAPGNSGGPLADARGRAVGINSMIAGGTAVAIPTEAVERFLGEGDRRPGFLGIVGRAVPLPDAERADGLLVTEIVAGSPAETAGLIPGDVLVALDGAAGLEAIAVALRGIVAGTALRLELLRGGRRVEIEAVPGEAPASRFASA